jgi:hypothetical protein
MNLPTHLGRKSILVRTTIEALLLCISWQFAMRAGGLRAADLAPEYLSKATSLVSFPDYVRWPVRDASPLTLGILGEDPFDGALDKLKLKRSKSVADLKDCQIIFISKSEKENLGAIIDSLGGANILTVGDWEGFAKQGGIIGFVLEGDKVRFEINAGAARRAGLGIDLRLLKVALRVFSS